MDRHHNKHDEQRPVSAPAGTGNQCGAQQPEIISKSPILSCSISMTQDPDKCSRSNVSALDDNSSNGCTMPNEEPMMPGDGRSIEAKWRHATSAGRPQTDSSAATRELFKLVSELSDCQDVSEISGDCCHRSAGVSLENNLLYCSRELLKLKDFSAEVRASMDVEQFVHQAELMLDMKEVSVEDIIVAMLEKVMSNDRAPTSRMDEAKEVIFVPNSSMLLARTIQGMSSLIDTSGQPTDTSYDQSWLCALCGLSQVTRRHMVVARFKQPTNLVDNAHEVRLFALMVTPNKEKDTKSALETGRTFATMLTNAAFRKQLLDARSETEFKSLMMVRAQQLSKTKKSLKNRHKYMLAPAVHHSISSLSNTDLVPCGGRDGQRKRRQLEQAATTCCKADPASRLHTHFDFRASTTDAADTDTSCQGHKHASSGGRLFSKNHGSSNILELISQSGDSKTADSPEPSRTTTTKDSYAAHHHEKMGHPTKPEVEATKGSHNLGTTLELMDFGKGLCGDIRRRINYYISDFEDAIKGPPKTVQKTVATIWFLYFGILLPTIAFSALNTNQTNGHMGDLRKAIIGQAIGGLGFALFGGQPLVIIMTTAPLCLYTRVIHQMCIDFGFHFPAMYAAVGLWNGVFLCIYSLLGFSRLMKWCTRSTEEIFALFIVIAFISDASKDLAKNFRKYYYTPACDSVNSNENTAGTLAPPLPFNTSLSNNVIPEFSVCRRETSLLFVLLMLGTLWLATTLYRFRKTRYLGASKRELLADYALPAAVIIMSYVGSYVFDSIYVERFPPLADIRLERAKVELLPLSGVFVSLGLGFTLSLLFFMDQNISAAMVNAPQNGLKKGCAYHFDLFVVGILNGFLALYGFPMMHGVLPHSPLHVRSLADIEERVEEGHLREVIVNVRETRVTGIVSHILVLGSLYLIPYPIAYIPTAVLNGLFLYMAVTSLDGLQIFERILLLFTEQSKYPPNHYIRRCPQRKIHQFTMFQLLQLLVMCLFGFSPFNIVEMFFPVIILLMIPFRHRIVPKYINEKYLDALDGKH